MKMPKQKLDVEVVFPSGDSVILKKRKTIEGKIQIESGSKGRGNEAWNPEFTRDSIVTVKRGRIIKRSRKKVIVRLGADKCLEFPKVDDKTTLIPSCDRDTISRLFDAKVLKAAGMSALNVKVPWYVTALLLVLLLINLFQFAVSRGLINVK